MHNTPVMNLPSGTRPGMTPPRKWYAASVCGTPLPRTSGNTQASKAPVTRLTATGTTNSRAVDGSSPKNRRVVQSMATVNNTAASPAITPTTMRERQKQLVFTQAKLLDRGAQRHHCRSASWRRPIRSNARSNAEPWPHVSTVCCSMR